MFHASHPNASNARRVGLALRYITPQARQTRVDHDFATLVRGEDRMGILSWSQSRVPRWIPTLLPCMNTLAMFKLKFTWMERSEPASKGSARLTTELHVSRPCQWWRPNWRYQGNAFDRTMH